MGGESDIQVDGILSYHRGGENGQLKNAEPRQFQTGQYVSGITHFFSKKTVARANDGEEQVIQGPPTVWSKIDHNSSQIEQTRLEPKCLPCQSVIGETPNKSGSTGKRRSKGEIEAFGANLERLLQY
jgi:hypothetical protein